MSWTCIAYTCLPEPEGESSRIHCSDILPLRPAKSKSIPEAFLFKGKLTEFYQCFPFGTILQRLEPTTPNAPTHSKLGGRCPGNSPFVAGSRENLARTSAPPEKEPESAENEADCGEKWRESLAKYDLDTSSWKIPQCLFQGDLSEYSGTWPRWGTMQNGECWERMPPELCTNGTESGLKENGGTPDNIFFFHTPNCGGLDGGSNSRKALRRRTESGLKENWPTPQTRGFTNDGDLKALARMCNDFEEMSQMAYRAAKKKKRRVYWPTPVCMDSLPPKSAKALMREATVARPGRSRPANLRDCVQPESIKIWPTPKASEPGMSAKTSGRDVTKSTHLTTQVALAEGMIDPGTGRMWPTPTAHCANETGCPSQLKRDTVQLGDLVADRERGLMLNPDWVELLMGWPKGWTNLEPLQSAEFQGWGDGWEEGTPRVGKDIPARADRLKAIGNGQVPQCAAMAWQILTQQSGKH